MSRYYSSERLVQDLYTFCNNVVGKTTVVVGSSTASNLGESLTNYEVFSLSGGILGERKNKSLLGMINIFNSFPNITFLLSAGNNDVYERGFRRLQTRQFFKSLKKYLVRIEQKNVIFCSLFPRVKPFSRSKDRNRALSTAHILNKQIFQSLKNTKVRYLDLMPIFKFLGKKGLLSNCKDGKHYLLPKIKLLDVQNLSLKKVAVDRC